MDILGQIQADLLDQNVPLSVVLRKAKVLASQLQSDDLANWVSQELNGYDLSKALPDYRVLNTTVAGTWTNGAWIVQNHSVQVSSIEDDKLRMFLTRFPVHQGIHTVEQFTKMPEDRRFMLRPEVTAVINSQVGERGYGYSQIHYLVGPHNFEQILDTVRNRLLDFILKLGKQWNPMKEQPIQAEVNRLVSVVIYNHPQGGPMTVFDQRSQQVQYQYNAAGNINVDAVQDKSELASELEKLREEVERAKESKTLEEDSAIEAEYHLLQASKEAKKEKPNKSSFLEHIGKAKALLEDVAAAAGLVTALLKAADIANTIFH